MSDNSEPEPIYQSQEEAYADFQENEEEEYEKFKEERLRKIGIDPNASPLGDSVHPKTTKSYAALGTQPPDTPYLVSRRPHERLKRMLTEMGKPPKIQMTINSVSRLKDNDTGKEYLTYAYTEVFEDRNGNEKRIHYTNVGVHEIITGHKQRNLNTGEVIGTEITGKKIVFDIEWSPKEFDKLMKKHSTGTTEMLVGFARTKGSLNSRAVYSNDSPIYSIKNIEDFRDGKFEDLYQLGQRALSTLQPSLSKLSQPVAEDPKNSLHKLERGYILPSAVSYSQTSYR
ncbi:hypothetical protein BH18THE2_BH18THE2_09240 [soil metagenome]